MKYPKFLENSATIGLLATSCGSNVNPYRLRTMEGIKYFTSLGYKIKRGHRIYRNYNATSATPLTRATDFMKMYQNKHIDFLWSTGGGELMINMLPYVDFNKISKLPPKFFMGFSDNTNLTFTLTTICDVATIYGPSIGAFSYANISVDALDAYKLMRNEKLSFTSYPFYFGSKSKDAKKSNHPLENIQYLDINNWESLNEGTLEIEGRIIGGCLDCLVCLCGTKFDNVANFINLYQDDGFIWYFDVCDLNSTALYRALFQLINANWLKHVKAILVGRMGNDNVILNYSFLQALKDALLPLKVPVLYNVDISHVSPSLPIINGAIAKITYKDHQGTISYYLK